MHNSDHSNFIDFIRQFPEQIRESQNLTKDISITVDVKKLRNIVLAGMGGSAISGDILFNYLKNDLSIPYMVHRNYNLPKFIDAEGTLFIACSYSGNTEETFTATTEAIERNANILILTSGGKLSDLAMEKSIPIITIPEGYPPRQALGFMFFPMLYLFEKVGIISLNENELIETYRILCSLRDRFDPYKSQGHNLCNHIAQKLYKKIPIIYTAAELLFPLVTRWRNQLNENAKVLAFSNVFPELNHNEIMGWELRGEQSDNFSIMFLRDKSELPRNKKRLEITCDMLRKNGYQIFELFGEGESALARLFTQLYICDWVSYYLALLNGRDPTKIESIDALKQALQQT